MKIEKVELPSNKKFGFFFAIVFAFASGYFYYHGKLILSCLLATTAVIFFLISILKADLLLPFNKLWMRFGLLLGIIVSPIVMGVIFFGLFTPISFLMRLSGRDELGLKFQNKTSYWILRNSKHDETSFKNQF